MGKNNALANIYTEDILFDNFWYYIHKKSEHIGFAAGGKGETDGSLAEQFNVMRNNNFLVATLISYKKDVKDRIDPIEFDLVDYCLDGDPYENILNSLASGIEANLKEMEENLSVVQEMQNIDIKKLLNKNTSTEELDKILMSIRKCVETLYFGTNLKEILLACIPKTGFTTNKKSNLENLVKKFKKEAEEKNLTFSEKEQKQGEILLGQIESLGRMIEKNASTKSISTLIYNNIYSTNFGELAAAIGVKKGRESALEALSGTSKTPLKIIRQDGSVIKGPSAQGKVDLIENNYKITIDESKDLTITLSVFGASVKTYKNLGLNKGSNYIFLGSSGITLEQAFSVLGFEKRQKYLGYNVLSWDDVTFPSAADSIYNLFATHLIMNLIARRGEDDLSDVLIVNGQVVPLYYILQKAISEEFLLGTRYGEDSSFLKVSLKGRKAAIVASRSKQGLRNTSRIAKAKAAFQAVKLGAEIHWNKIYKGYIERN